MPRLLLEPIQEGCRDHPADPATIDRQHGYRRHGPRLSRMKRSLFLLSFRPLSASLESSACASSSLRWMSSKYETQPMRPPLAATRQASVPPPAQGDQVGSVGALFRPR